MPFANVVDALSCQRLVQGTVTFTAFFDLVECRKRIQLARPGCIDMPLQWSLRPLVLRSFLRNLPHVFLRIWEIGMGAVRPS